MHKLLLPCGGYDSAISEKHRPANLVVAAPSPARAVLVQPFANVADHVVNILGRAVCRLIQWLVDSSIGGLSSVHNSCTNLGNHRNSGIAGLNFG